MNADKGSEFVRVQVECVLCSATFTQAKADDDDLCAMCQMDDDLQREMDRDVE